MLRNLFSFIALLGWSLTVFAQPHHPTAQPAAWGWLTSLTLQTAPAAASSQSYRTITPLNDTITTTQPSGQVFDGLFRDGQVYGRTPWGGVEGGKMDALVGCYVVGDDGFIYLKNPFSRYGETHFLKLTDNGDGSFTAHMPQQVLEEPGAVFYAMRLVYRDDLQSYRPDTTADGNINADLTFTLVNDTLRMEDTDILTVLGLVNGNGNWIGYGEYEMRLYPNSYQCAVPPSSAQSELYELEWKSDDFSSSKVVTKVAIDDRDVYLQDPSSLNSGRWWRGTMEGDSVVFPSWQYGGIDEELGMHLFFVGATFTERTESQGTYNDFTVAPSLRLRFNRDDRSMVNTDTVAFLTNASPLRLQYVNAYERPQFTLFTPTVAAPRKPVIQYVSPYDPQYGYGMGYYLYSEDEQGNYLIPDYVYYHVYVNGSTTPLTFTPEHYLGLEEPITDIPLHFTDNRDFVMFGDEWNLTLHGLTDLDSIGISANYAFEGNHESEIVWYPTQEYLDAIQPLSDGSQKPMSVAWYDLQGRPIARPQSGLYLKVTTFTDGERRVEKRIAPAR